MSSWNICKKIAAEEDEKSTGKAKKTTDMLDTKFDKKTYEFCTETRKFKTLKKILK